MNGDGMIRKGLRNSRGFTLLELLTVITIIGILATIAVPMYQRSVIKAKEAALKDDLYQMRESIDKYYADHGKYPTTLSVLVDSKYMRWVPVDPFTNTKDSWVEVRGGDAEGVFDVKSGSELVGTNGTPYSEW